MTPLHDTARTRETRTATVAGAGGRSGLLGERTQTAGSCVHVDRAKNHVLDGPTRRDHLATTPALGIRAYNTFQTQVATEPSTQCPWRSCCLRTRLTNTIRGPWTCAGSGCPQVQALEPHHLEHHVALLRGKLNRPNLLQALRHGPEACTGFTRVCTPPSATRRWRSNPTGPRERRPFAPPRGENVNLGKRTRAAQHLAGKSPQTRGSANVRGR